MDKYTAANAEFCKFSRKYMELKKGLPIRPSEVGILNILAETPGPHSSVMLAELLGVSKPMITAHVNALLEKGYITKQQSKEDKRVYYVLLTEKALQFVEETKKDTKEQLERMMDEIGQDSFDRLVALIHKVNQVLEESRTEK